MNPYGCKEVSHRYGYNIMLRLWTEKNGKIVRLKV